MSASTHTSSHPRVLVYGGAGALGRAMVTAFKACGASVDSVDFSVNPEASHNLIVDSKFEESLVRVVKEIEVENAKSTGGVYDAVICAAGGWAGGGLKGETHELLASVEKMYQMNFQTTLAASHISAKFLKAGGFVMLTGANVGRGGTPGMIGYGISKAATHQLAQSLNDSFAHSHSGSCVITILPITLDTPANRVAMPDGNTSTWTPCSEIANNMVSWTTQPSTRPESGSMLLVETKDNITAWSPVHTNY